MEAFIRLTGTAAPLLRDDVDTDQIIPMPAMVAGIDADFGAGLFARWRYDAAGRPREDFVLNQQRYQHARILLVGDNFGCGSSREHAVWALLGFGVRCVIGVGFSDIFAANCARQGLLLVQLPRPRVEALAARLAGEETSMVSVDLENQTLEIAGQTEPFAVDATLRLTFLAGADEIEETLARLDEINRWEAADRQRRPWIYQSLRVAIAADARS